MSSDWNPREDGRRGPTPSIVEEHSGTPAERVRWSCGVRLPWQRRRRVRLVIRAYPPYAPDTARMTVALELDDE